MVWSSQVYPFYALPNCSMIPFTWSRGMLVVPLKFMCSTQCDTLVRPGSSSREPTLDQHHTDTSGAVCSPSGSTFNPFSSSSVLRGAVHPASEGLAIHSL